MALRPGQSQGPWGVTAQFPGLCPMVTESDTETPESVIILGHQFHTFPCKWTPHGFPGADAHGEAAWEGPRGGLARDGKENGVSPTQTSTLPRFSCDCGPEPGPPSRPAGLMSLARMTGGSVFYKLPSAAGARNSSLTEPSGVPMPGDPHVGAGEVLRPLSTGRNPHWPHGKRTGLSPPWKPPA